MVKIWTFVSSFFFFGAVLAGDIFSLNTIPVVISNQPPGDCGSKVDDTEDDTCS